MLTEKDAFQMILNTIFSNKPMDTIIHECVKTEDNTTDEVNKFIEYIKPILADFNKRITALEENSQLKKEEEVKKTSTAPKRANGGNSRKKRKTAPEGLYEFPESYKKNLNWEIKNDGTIGGKQYKRGVFEAYQVLNLFKKVDLPFSNKDYITIKSIIENQGFNIGTGMSFLYHLQNDLSRGDGQFIDIIYKIYSNEYSLPAYLDFKVQNKQITINNVETGIKPFQVKQWIDEIELHGECAMIKIMKNNQHLSQKYLWYILNYYDRKELLEVLE